MPEIPSRFRAWAAMDAEQGKKLDVVPFEYEPKKWTEEDVDIKVQWTSICGSCIHTITSGWGASQFPCVVGHEIVGEVVRAGKNSGHSVGEIVGVGAQGGSCRECDQCKSGQEQYCTKGMVGTYQGKWPEDQGEGRHQQGGYGEYHRTRGHFAITLPKDIKPEHAAPMMCGGVTLFTPLTRFGAGPGKSVGIVGIGGLGHFGILFSIALGAETYAISHSESKKQECVEKMGLKPDNFIVSHDPQEMKKQLGGKLDLVIVTSNQKNPPVAEFLALCKPKGTVCFVGLAEEQLPRIPPTAIVGNGVQLAGSKIGSPDEIRAMLKVAQEKNVHPIVQTRPLAECSQALKDMNAGKARFRIVMDASQSGL